MGLLIAEEVVLNEESDIDLHTADTLDKLLHGPHIHEMWTLETSRVYKHRVLNPPAISSICPCLACPEALCNADSAPPALEMVWDPSF